MYKILKLNNIASEGLSVFENGDYHLGDEITSPDAILLRSFNMHEMDIPESVQAIGRAGSGVNNIPIDKLSELAIPVFNAPGANANAVKELALAAILIAARNIHRAMDYIHNLKSSDNLKSDIESAKKQYVGYELPNKTLGVIGLGSIGIKVANAGYDLGMKVLGFDPMITIDNAINLVPGVKKYNDLNEVLKNVDILTIHIPYKNETKDFISENEINLMKNSATIINLSREEIVNTDAVIKALENKKLNTYVTDFPNDSLIGNPDVLLLPHLGASTKEAETNCAVMVANSIKSYLESGDIINSVNFPDVSLVNDTKHRLTITNLNKPNIVGQFTSLLGKENININDLSHKNYKNIGYTILNLDKSISHKIIEQIEQIDGVIKTNIIS
ncbi:MAG TPA: 3-phosphoglycerate dehydrogenase [Gammaproteobacteria bacterium]|jgi:D-3-phosphoglycerate dehydrogenase|nr:3-phosphoglycerate dehydrogenase [Gammaproteobacteria bacterium]